MTNTSLLKEAMKKSGRTIGFMCDKLGITRQAFWSKMHNHSEFTCSQIATLRQVLDLSSKEVDSIFFGV